MKKLFLLLLIPVAALVWWAAQSAKRAPDVPFARVKRETLVSTLPTNGKVEPIQWTPIRAEKAGLVREVRVQEGQAVGQGAVLATMTDPAHDADLTAAEARLTQARAELATVQGGGRPAQLTEIENSLRVAKAERDSAKADYDTLSRLLEKKAATAVEVETARRRVNTATLSIEALERSRAALVGTNDKSVADAKVREAERAIELVRRRMLENTIRSPQAGVIYGLVVRPGSYLAIGDPVANVGRLERLRVRVYVDEPELGRVVEGQPVKITWDALPGKTWEGTVEKKPVTVQAFGTRQVGEVLCTIENPGRDLIAGTNVNAEIRTNVVENALTMPKEAQRRDASGPGVFSVGPDNHLVWKPITIGSANIARVQVLTGLKEGDPVALPTEQSLKPGQIVNATYP